MVEPADETITRPAIPIEYYGFKYPIQDCTSGTCFPGYLYLNGYIPANRINSVDANGKPNGIMGVPGELQTVDRASDPLGPDGASTKRSGRNQCVLLLGYEQRLDSAEQWHGAAGNI